MEAFQVHVHMIGFSLFWCVKLSLAFCTMPLSYTLDHHLKITSLYPSLEFKEKYSYCHLTSLNSKTAILPVSH